MLNPPYPVLDEFSVVFTERSVNHMSAQFQSVMRAIHSNLCQVYAAQSCTLIPGGGTYAMEAVARQFGTNAKVAVVRNGLFSYRWSQIFDAAQIAQSVDVFCAKQIEPTRTAPFSPYPIDELIVEIERLRPNIVIAPHVETSAGIRLPNDYIRALADAAHGIGALLIIDSIASGADWLNMTDLGIDVLISAPQKGWSASPSCGVVLMSERALTRLETTQSQSFSIDLKKWHQITDAYLKGGHAYHATMPTDALIGFAKAIDETLEFGLEKARNAQNDLGTEIRSILANAGFQSVAAPGFEASGVVVSYTQDAEMSNGKKFAAQGTQIAAGVPLFCDERTDFQTFRLGLFGLDKWQDVPKTVERFKTTLNAL